MTHTHQNYSLLVLKGYSESFLENQGINVDGEHLTHLRLADDIVLISNNAEHLQEMLNDLNIESLKLGIKMYKGKTRVMFNDKTQHNLNQSTQ